MTALALYVNNLFQYKCRKSNLVRPTLFWYIIRQVRLKPSNLKVVWSTKTKESKQNSQKSTKNTYAHGRRKLVLIIIT